MRRLLLILRNDVRRHLKAPLPVIIFILIPLMMTGLIGTIFAPRADESRLPPIQVLLVDHDQGLVSRLLAGAFDNEEMRKTLQVTVTDEAEGRERMHRGRASAMVIIPEQFTVDLLDAKPVTLEIIKNPAEQFLPDIVEEFVNTLAVVLSGAVQAFTGSAPVLSAGGGPGLRRRSQGHPGHAR